MKASHVLSLVLLSEFWGASIRVHPMKTFLWMLLTILFSRCFSSWTLSFCCCLCRFVLPVVSREMALMAWPFGHVADIRWSICCCWNWFCHVLLLTCEPQHQSFEDQSLLFVKEHCSKAWNCCGTCQPVASFHIVHSLTAMTTGCFWGDGSIFKWNSQWTILAHSPKIDQHFCESLWRFAKHHSKVTFQWWSRALRPSFLTAINTTACDPYWWDEVSFFFQWLIRLLSYAAWHMLAS